MPVKSTAGAALRRSMSRASTRRRGTKRALSERESRTSAVCNAASAVATLPLSCNSCSATVMRRRLRTSTHLAAPRQIRINCSRASSGPLLLGQARFDDFGLWRAARASASARFAVSLASSLRAEARPVGCRCSPALLTAVRGAGCEYRQAQCDDRDPSNACGSPTRGVETDEGSRGWAAWLQRFVCHSDSDQSVAKSTLA